MIQVSNLGRRYGKKTVLQEISFTAQCGGVRSHCRQKRLRQDNTDADSCRSIETRWRRDSLFWERTVKELPLLSGILWVCASGSAILEELSVKDNLKLWGVDRSAQYEWIIRAFDL
mgnify:CR=1 FL=1